MRFLYLAVTFLAAASAQTGTWTGPVVLSAGGQGWEAAAAIDGNGSSLALWDERTSMDHIWSRPKPSAGAWGRVTQVSPGSLGLQTTSVFPAVRISAAGFATAVWTDSDGVWTADRPPDSKWNPPQLLISGASSPIFVMNSNGDAAVAWTVGGPTATQSSVFAVLRPSGEAWTSPQTVATGVHIAADHAAIGKSGAAVVTWESYTAVCSEGFCSLSNFVLHAVRQNAGAGIWVDSGALQGPDEDSHDARVALDSAGQAMLVAFSGSGAYVSATQGASGGAWSAFNTVVDPQNITIVSDLASGLAGNVTLVYELIGFSTSQAFAVSGAIGGNTWSAPVVLSGSDTNVSQIYFALAPSGAAVAAWLESSATPKIHAVVRASATAAWGDPVTVSQPGSTEMSPEAAGANSAGAAIVIYSGYNPNSVHTEYGVNYTP
jgi:hypothetical protein